MRGDGFITERPRANGRTAYLACWWDPIKRRQRTRSFNDRDDAEDHLREIARAKRAGKYRSPSEITVSQLVAEYIDRMGQANRIVERTQLTYRHRAKMMIDPTIGRRKLSTIEPLDVQRWIDSLTKDFKPSTIHAAVAVLQGALREAALLGITNRHLGQGIRRPSIGRQTSETWTERDVKRVLTAVADDPIYGAFYAVAIATGERPGELRALQWRDVLLDEGMITIARTVTKDIDGREVIADRTKSKQSRGVAISGAVVDRLRWHKARQAERRLASDRWVDLGLVFDRGDGHFIATTSWQRFHRDLCERVGVAAIRLHDLRHTSASLELATGAHVKIVADRLGHSKVAMTLDRYTHVSASLQREAAQNLSDRLFGSAQESETKSGT